MRNAWAVLLFAAAFGAGTKAIAQTTVQAPDTLPSADVRQAREDAWWTGPMVANSAASLPHRHFLIEPYLYDVRSSHSDGFGSLTYIQYGLTDRLTLGLIPTFGYNRVSGGPSSSSVGAGDLGVLAQYGITQFHDGSAMPAIALMLQETFPTGKYDHLGDRTANAQGNGARTTTLQVNTQTYFWMPTGRILRMRFNVARSFSGSARVHDVSVYGTGEGFRGNGRPGRSSFVNAAWEYSLTQHWVMAFDLFWRRASGSLVDGTQPDPLTGLREPLHFRTRSSISLGFAPAIEYNFSGTLGLLVGTRVITGGHNNPTTVTPAVALNYVH